MSAQEDKKIKSKSYTRASDMLFKMIEPRVIEIEARFSNGEKLTSEDINTLMLNAQYNHTNHLDDKLNSVVADVASLENKFDSRFTGLKNNFDSRFTGLKNDFDNKFTGLKNDFKFLEQGVNNKIEAQNLEFKTFKAEIKEIFAKVEGNIAVSNNKMMLQMTGILGILMAIFKFL